LQGVDPVPLGFFVLPSRLLHFPPALQKVLQVLVRPSQLVEQLLIGVFALLLQVFERQVGGLAQVSPSWAMVIWLRVTWLPRNN
jgi:hypothetical protein